MNTSHNHAYDGRVSRAVVLLLLLSLSACAERRGADSKGAVAGEASSDELSTANYMLLPEEIDKFQPGRSMEDILGGIKGRGALAMAAEYNGSKVYVVTYDIVSEDYESLGYVVLAVFIDDKFVKFVDSVPWEMIEDEIDGTPISRAKPTKVGDVDWLAGAVEADALNIDDMKEIAKTSPDVPEHVDPGLTVVWLALRKSLEAAGQLPTEDDVKRNARLCDQFNALRLRLGMSEGEVAAALNAGPIESGRVAAGLFKIYGSDESFMLLSEEHFMNVLVLFKRGRAAVIYTIPASDGLNNHWRDVLRDMFIDIP